MRIVEARRTMQPVSSKTRAVVIDHPLAAYLGIAYALSWAYWVPLAIGPRTTAPGVGWPSHMPGLFGPAIAAIVVTAIVGGRSGLSDIWRRLTLWRVGWWWLSVIAILAAGGLGILVASDITDMGDLTVFPGISASIGPLLTIGVVFVVNGVGEELGWRGFLADGLLRDHSLTTTSLLVALAWALWHLPLFFFQGTFQGFSPASITGWAVGLTAGSVVLTWLYRGSGASILLVAVWHTAFNFTSATPAAEGVVAAITSTMVMVAAVAILLVEWRHRRRFVDAQPIGRIAES